MTAEPIPPTSPRPSIGTARRRDFADAARIAGAVPLADIAPVPLRWLWPGRIPIGRVTLLVSDPGLGKSLVTLDVAARVSSGTPWPDAAGQRQGDKEKGGQGETRAAPARSLSPCLPVSLSPCLLVSLSPCLLVSLSPCLLVSLSPPLRCSS